MNTYVTNFSVIINFEIMIKTLNVSKKKIETPTLENLNLFKIGISVWNSIGVKKLLSDFEFSFFDFKEKEKEWKENIVTKVKDMVKFIPIPDTNLKKYLIQTIEEIGTKIFLCKHCPGTTCYINGYENLSLYVNNTFIVQFFEIKK